MTNHNGAPAAISNAKPLVIGAAVGALSGLPLSYFLQNQLLREKVNIFQYTGAIFTESQMFSEMGYYGPVISAVIVGLLVGAGIGFMVSRRK